MPQASDNPLEAGREARRSRSWERAYGLFATADAAAGLAPEDLEALGEAAWVTGRYDDALRAMERAHAGYLARDDEAPAALMAVALANEYFSRGELAVGAGWHATAKRMLEALPECRAHALHAWTEAQLALIRQELQEALARSGDMREIGSRLGEPDVEMLGLATQGRALALLGRVAEATAAVDEAMAVAVSGRLHPWAACQVYCQTLTVCGDLADYRRAGEWTVEAQRCCVRETIVPASGDCRVHRACVLRWRGAWTEAEADARLGCEELHGNVIHVGMAHYEIGEMRLRQGKLAAAEEAFGRAHEFGRSPQPGLALLRLAQGRLEAARGLIEQALVEETVDLRRAQLLSARVEIALAASDGEAAHAAARELGSIAGSFGTLALQASFTCADGAIKLAEGSDAACGLLRRGIRLWREVGAPYEVARARALLAKAHLDRGDPESAALELRAARRTFRRLGAERDARHTAEALASISNGGTPETTVSSRAFMFTDIVASTPLLEAIGDEAWLHVLRWHDETLRALFLKHDGEEINKTGDGFFVAFEDAGRAITCATDLQRTLAEHRESHGFAPRVRVGIHAGHATHSGDSYEGKGVHVAARVGALAQSEEILITRESLPSTAASVDIIGQHEAQLKGIREPVQLVAVRWR
jgi:class 3 adenylate cyclase